LTKDSKQRSKLGDTIFAVFHLFLLITVVVYAVIGLVQGNTMRFAVMMAGLVLYYFLVLHKAVLKEIDRKRKLRSAGPPGKP
jgi:Flp pilus assembly protein TadB